MRAVVTAALALALLALALLTLAGAEASAASYTEGRPLAVVGHANGNLEVFWRARNGDLLEDSQSAGAWRGPVDLGMGPLGSAPAATAGPGGADYVFWEGTDAAIWQATNASGSWVGPARIGMGPLGSQPTATSWANSSGAVEIDLFWQGTDGNLWQGYYPFSTGAWNGPYSHGMGHLGSAPSAAAQGTGSGAAMQVFWRGTNDALWQGQTGGSSWTGPTSLGMGPLNSAPTVARLPSGEEDVFWMGTDSALWQARSSGASWSGPTRDGIGPLASAPTAAATSPGELAVFWVGTDGDLWEATDHSGTWTSVVNRGPMVIPPHPPSAPAPVTIAPRPLNPGAMHTRHLRAMRTRIVMRWSWSGSRTWLRGLGFKALPRGARVRVSCRGLLSRPITVRRRGLHRLIRSLERRTFRGGQRLVFRLVAPGYTAERAEVRIRDGRLPLARLL